jgi:AmmeMemoRadiSam system protein B
MAPRRRAVLAGSWYPDSATACERQIAEFTDVEFEGPDGPFVGGIVPHAGWFFSGQIACRVIQQLAKGPGADLLAVFGMHLHPGSRNHLMAEGEWETPLGPLAVDEEMADALRQQFDFKIETAADCVQDNTIEVQLPFIRHYFPEARILPMGLPPVAGSLEIGKAVVAAARRLGRRIRIVGSTDLTHYGANYGFAPQGGGLRHWSGCATTTTGGSSMPWLPCSRKRSLKRDWPVKTPVAAARPHRPWRPSGNWGPPADTKWLMPPAMTNIQETASSDMSASFTNPSPNWNRGYRLHR